MVYVDNEGNEKKTGGETDSDIVLRELPFRIGQLYNTEDGRRALRDIFALQLFDNVQVCRPPVLKTQHQTATPAPRGLCIQCMH